MKLVDIIRKEVILPAIRSHRRYDVIGELAAQLAERLEDVSQEEIVRVLVEREKRGSTAIGEGIAIPHGTLDSVGKLAACFGRSRKGVHFGSADGQPTHFFLALIAPPNSAGNHLKLLARFSQVFRDPEVRRKLMAAKTTDEMFQIIVEADSR
jgi:PTS system nitrogen regulatory IIA component